MSAGERATAPAAASAPGRGLGRLPWLLCLAALGALIARAAWLSDDAYITFRTVANLVAGDGPRWNLAERVQSYTHPLWMLLLAGGRLVSGEMYGSALGLSLGLSLAACALVTRPAATSAAGAWAAAAALACSKAFVDYSTSGLEGPLVHALVAALVLAAAPPAGARSALALAGSAALLLTARPDALPLVAPLLAAGIAARRRQVRPLLLGSLPLVAWTAFAFLYYGFPLPNTAAAKLGSGLPRSWLVGQGLAYLGDSMARDPATLGAIAGALAAALWRRERTALLLSGGILLELAYVVWIGGDFMSGRFLAAPLFASALILARTLGAREALPLATFLVALALASPRSPLRAPTAYGALLDGSQPHDHIDDRGITDERAYWFHYTGLLSPARTDPARKHVTRGHPFGASLREGGPRVRVVNGMGFTGYFAGPAPHLVDPMGLTDALLARLPIWRDGTFLAEQDTPEGMALPWRIGHFVRPIPEGYLETLASGENELASPALAAAWDELALITRAPLLAPGRLRAILAANLGSLRRDVERYLAGG